MASNQCCAKSFLIGYAVTLIIAMGIGAAAFDLSLAPRPGAWYPIFLGLVSLCLGLAHTKESANDCLRIAFIIVGVFAVIVTVIGALVDGGMSSYANSMDQCFPYSGNSNTDSYNNCCQYVQSHDPDYAQLFAGWTDEAKDELNQNAMCNLGDDSGDCLCCIYANRPRNTKGYEWIVKGSCGVIQNRLRRLLSLSFVANFIAVILLVVALSIACCRCCGPRTSSDDVVIATTTVVQANPVMATAVHVQGPVTVM